ncbi:MAG: hypothetical protein V5A62_15995 [Haloarculaceae archaeon]
MNQTRNLSLLGLGVDGDVQPDEQYPALTTGNHLRWAFAPHRGFPRNGYYVFRREHEGPKAEPILLTDALPEKVIKKGIENSFSTPDDKTFKFSDPSTYSFQDAYELEADRTVRSGSDGKWEFNLQAGALQTITLPEPAHRVEVSMVDEGASPATMTAFADDRVVDEEMFSGAGIVTLEADHITKVCIVGQELSLVELACFPLLAEAKTDWSLLTDAPAPITLPLSHPDYPAATGPEDLPTARQTARDRVDYGPADRIAPDATTVEAAGTVSVVDGESIVTGQGTAWTDDLAGAVLRLDSDDTGYVVAQVLDDDRLALGRAYRGTAATNASYKLVDDHFGQLHDYLTHLVDGGAAAGGMAARTVPEPAHDAGTIQRTANKTVVQGIGTGWDADLEGLTLRTARDVGGTVAVVHGIPAAFSTTADWDEDLVGDRFRIDGERETYTITGVRSFAYQGQTFSLLEFNRPISGPHYPSQGLDYDVLEADGVPVATVDDQDTLELAHPHPGPDDGTARNYVMTSPLSAGGLDGVDVPSMPDQYPIELALLASVDPAVAQQLGLYWIDDTADPGTAYDYLVVADHGLQQYREQRILTHVPEPVESANLPAFLEHPVVDFAMKTAVTPGDADRIDEPSDGTAYALPPTRGRSDVGLRWDREGDPIGEDAPAAYYLWRRDCGDEPPETAPAPASYDVLTREDAPADDGFMATAEPILRTAAPDDPPEPLPGWPDEPMHAVDTNLADSWYSYRVSAIDLFGRHSPLSEPATWTDPDGPHPHPAADRAVEVAADLPPTPPTGIEASALDPDDPHVRADDAYEDWRADNNGEVGLRVRWRWTEERAGSAPDVEAFKVHFQPGRLNAHAGTITGVSTSGDGYHVETDIDTDVAADVFAGATLQVGARGFPIVASGGDPLWVEVAPADPTADTAVTDGGLLGGFDPGDLPADPLDGGTLETDDLTFTLAPIEPDDECTVTVPAAYARGTVTIRDDVVTVDGEDRTVVRGTDTGWTDALVGQDLRTVDDIDAYEVYRVDSPTKLLLDRVYEPPDGFPAEHRTYAIAHPAGIDYTDAANWSRSLATVQYDDDLPQDEEWPRVYETFVTLADTTGFEPSVTEPKTFTNVSVNAVDDAGQDGPVAAPAKVARVHREKPEPPAIPVIETDFEWASEADYHGQSRYTVRWEKTTDDLRTHVFRALDETLFSTDWERRQAAIDDGRADELTITESEHDRFPDPLRPDDGDDDTTLATKQQSRETIADELNRLNDPADLAGDEDAAMTFYRSLRDPNDDGGDVEALKPAMLRVLAGLPGNETAYTQVTVNSLDPDEHPNEPGPDTGLGESYPQGDLCAYVDSFDGQASNCYFYRTGTVDPAGNRSDQGDAVDGELMSYPTPGVKSPDVVPPKKPIVTKILAGHPDEDEPGDRMITAWLAPTTEPDVAGYRVYRADDEDSTRDLRLMEQVATGIPPAGTGETVWTDEDVEAFRAKYYRFVAVDDAGNRSSPSPVVSARAFDDSRPDPPTWADPATDPETGAVQLGWSSEESDLRSLVQRRPTGETDWQNQGTWLTRGEYSYEDGTREDGVTYEYRLVVMDADGRSNDSYEVLTR